MISDVASLLKELMGAEARVISAQGITHAPTIGAMYEGLTRDILNRSIPTNLDLKVVSGFIEGANGKLSSQIDCMLVAGSGRKLPYAEAYVWSIENVIATIEVKKHLYGADLKDAFDKQRSLHRMYVEYMGDTENKVDLSPTFRAFAQLTGKYLQSYGSAEALPDLEKVIFHLLVIELLEPIRIIFVYEGYVSEHSLREGLIGFLGEHLEIRPTKPSPSELNSLSSQNGKEGFGAFSFPNLIVCRNNALLKANGYPYIAALDGEWWHILLSNNENPIRILIELIWTRLENQFGAVLPEDTNLIKERLAPLLKGTVKKMDDKYGWIYELVDVAQQNLVAFKADAWEPYSMGTVELTVAMMAANNGSVQAQDAELVEFARVNGSDAQTLIESLVTKRILAWEGDGVARPIYSNLVTLYMPDGTIRVSNNANLTGEWVLQRVDLASAGNQQK